ncbi:ER membrane protein complex subunit 6 [Lachnellula cervina]|uniref:ER membrane protein complex subunit 6 n=1 Tax=Lachnellula cervina TaxID=1316786 RepID=A0A7D8YVK3_9HELO|nr:ER membrane protein complex subunit 6 [Lachnellula cervina]
MLTERELQISPIVLESVQHNTKTLTTLHNLTASLFGVGAGILGLESYPGFIFYLVFSLLTSALVYAFRVRPAIIKNSTSGGKAGVGMERYFRGSMELWTGGLVEGLSGFVLTWTLFYGLVRA